MWRFCKLFWPHCELTSTTFFWLLPHVDIATWTWSLSNNVPLKRQFGKGTRVWFSGFFWSSVIQVIFYRIDTLFSQLNQKFDKLFDLFIRSKTQSWIYESSNHESISWNWLLILICSQRISDLRIKILVTKSQYRGSLSYATFGSRKNSHKPKIALAKYLPHAIFCNFEFSTESKVA